ncbi:2Fe-2S iron-sulfur cluster binding domain-containing protein [Kocuria coralli]|uniref:2Fe-2S iron-sulfur cluster binding domain-containing protein n=1 Tax=Kocuria coralli TaxID=1461025 RepID=A0A5J5L0D1_9MICC|nr:2Fe-2S iron-sulfur cluster-binding protein [Kocuria coralli]KAA9395419.1 2Fe-2S iron-sulfur cluster binding domain-containing protein [Kocuria coralli]
MSSITVNVIDRDGTRTPDVEWNDHESLMEALTRNKFPILATCGGNASCSTCHCYLGSAAETANSSSPIEDEEEDVLDMLDDTRHDDSRLTCQVEWSEELNGAEVTIAPEW